MKYFALPLQISFQNTSADTQKEGKDMWVKRLLCPPPQIEKISIGEVSPRGKVVYSFNLSGIPQITSKLLQGHRFAAFRTWLLARFGQTEKSVNPATAADILICSGTRVLLQQKDETFGVSNPQSLKWYALFGGRARRDELPFDRLRLELYEEFRDLNAADMVVDAISSEFPHFSDLLSAPEIHHFGAFRSNVFMVTIGEEYFDQLEKSLCGEPGLGEGDALSLPITEVLQLARLQQDNPKKHGHFFAACHVPILELLGQK